MTEERVTIRQLARLSGVSIGTVSRALNGYADVNPETRERIMRLARELDYTPAAAARSLVTQRSHLVGVFLETGEGHPDPFTNPFFYEVLVGLKGAIGEAGYDLLLFASERPGNGYGEHSYLKRARHHNVEGVVLMDVDPDEAEVRRLVRSDLACVGVDVELVGPATEYVISDSASGIALAMRHLHQLGHRRIATITGLLDTRPGADRLRAYRAEVQALGLALPEPPTAVVAASDLMALGALRAADEAGREVPRDVSIIGFDDIQLAGHVHPPLTTLRQDKAGLGAEAGRALLALISGDSDEPAVKTLPVELVVRGSTTSPPSGA